MKLPARLVRSLACALTLALATPGWADAPAIPPAPGLRLSEAPREEPREEVPVGWAIGAGTLTALVPLAIGSSLFATSGSADTARRKAASLTMVYGLGLAPIVSHLVAREWTRAAIFGAIPMACAVGMTVLLEIQPTVTFSGTREGRWTYGLLLSFTTLAAALGVADTFGAQVRATERARVRRRQARLPVLPMPFATPHGGGLAVGGAF